MPDTTSAASILDVAREARVSPATVSRVLNRRGNASPTIRQRVEQAAIQLGYRAKPAGRPSRQRRTVQLAAMYLPRTVVNGSATEAVRGFLKGFGQSAESAKAQVQVHVLAGSSHISQDIMLQQLIDDHEIDGLLLIGARQVDGYIEQLMAAKLPLVVMNNQPSFNEFSSVCVDYFRGAQTAAAHLHQLGHTRLGIMATGNGSWSHAQYRAGLAHYLKTHQLAPAVDYPMPELFTPEHKQQAVELMLDHGVTGIITGDYVIANMSDVFREAGASIPQQLSMVGFDNLGLTTDDGLSITSIGYDKRRMGRLAGRMLLQLIESGDKLSHLSATVGVEFIPGQTTAASMKHI